MNIGLTKLAMNAAKAAGKSVSHAVTSGEVFPLAQTLSDRRAICAACEHHTGLRCRKCGCITVAKTALITERCPIGKW